MDISDIRAILNGDATPNTGQYRVAMGKLYDFLTAFTGTDSADTAPLATLLGVTTPQRSGVVGSARNAKMSVTAASASANFVADEVIVESALGGERYCIPNVNKLINLATTGIGGMDAGSAPTSGFVAVYLGYNPTTGASGLFGQNATSSTVGEVYGGANRPAGYTATALVGIIPTNSSGQFLACILRNRRVSFVGRTALTNSTPAASLTLLSLVGYVPPNATDVGGWLQVLASSSSNTVGGSVSSTGSGNGIAAIVNSGLYNIQPSFEMLPLVTPQTMYYTWNVSAGTLTGIMNISSYSF